MSDLAAFRSGVRDARRLAGRTQQQLARAIGLHPHVLSHKLNGHASSPLTSRDVSAIVTTLAEWGGLAARSDALALLRAGGVPDRMVGAWQLAPLDGSSDDAPGSRRGPDVVQMRPAPPPQPVTPLVGRAAEIATIIGALDDARLVTITGAGGIGKTRVALQVAASAAPRFDDGVAFVDLALVSDPTLIDIAVLRALGMQPRTADSSEAELVDALRHVRILVVLDNMEHLLAGGALLGRLLAAAPGLHLLVTSRTRLRLYGEHEIRLTSLGLPPARAHGGAVRESDAVQLFIQRARAVRPGFDPEHAELATIGTLCALLDGLPLAIELVAVKVRVWAPSTLLERIRDRLPSITDGVRDRPSRHQTLAATLAWSDALLAADDRAAFLRLAVFAGSFDAAGLAAVTGTQIEAAGEQLERLEEQSLLEVAGPVTRDLPRFRLLEPVRQYALQRLAQEGAIEATRRAHLRHFLAAASAMGPPGPETVGDPELDRLYADRANVVAALAWACDRAESDRLCLEEGMRLVVAAGRMWARRAMVAVGLRYLRRLLDVDAQDRVVPAELRVAGLHRAGILLSNGNELDATEAIATEELELAAAIGHGVGMSGAYRLLGEVAGARGDLAAAEQYLARQLAVARALGDPVEMGGALNELGQTHRRLGRFGEARTELEQAVSCFTDVGDLDSVAAVLGSLGDLAFDEGDLVEAGQHQVESLRLHARYGTFRGVSYALEGCARVAAASGRPAEALRYVGAARRLRDEGGWVLPEPDRRTLEEILAGPVSTLGEAERRRAVLAGRLDDPEDVIVDALRGRPSGPSPAGELSVIDLRHTGRRPTGRQAGS